MTAFTAYSNLFLNQLTETVLSSLDMERLAGAVREI